MDRDDVRPVWEHFTEHTFVQGIANGSLPEGRFKHYLVQDYLYLVWLFTASFIGALMQFLMNLQVHFARSNALASYKGKSMESIAAVSPLPVNDLRVWLVGI